MMTKPISFMDDVLASVALGAKLHELARFWECSVDEIEEGLSAAVDKYLGGYRIWHPTRKRSYTIQDFVIRKLRPNLKGEIIPIQELGRRRKKISLQNARYLNFTKKEFNKGFKRLSS